MFGTDDIISRSVNPDHRTVSKTATQQVCNSHQSVMEPLQLKIRSSKLCLSRPWPPVLRRDLHRSNSAADPWLLSLALHSVHMHHHVHWGVTTCLLHQGLLRFHTRHNLAVSLWRCTLGKLSDQILNTLTERLSEGGLHVCDDERDLLNLQHCVGVCV